MLLLLSQTFLICGASVFISHCPQKDLHKTLCSYCAISVMLSQDPGGYCFSWWIMVDQGGAIPSRCLPHSATGTARSSSQMRKCTGRCKAPQISASQTLTSNRPLKSLVQMQVLNSQGCGRLRAGPRFCISNKLPSDANAAGPQTTL